MNEELLKFQDIVAMIRKHALLVSSIVGACFLIAFGASMLLPKKFKSTSVLNIKSSYFQMPLGSDLGNGGREASEMFSEKQALIRLALDDAFMDKMGEEFGVYSTNKDS